jgi:hypothetical protein
MIFLISLRISCLQNSSSLYLGFEGGFVLLVFDAAAFLGSAKTRTTGFGPPLLRPALAFLKQRNIVRCNVMCEDRSCRLQLGSRGAFPLSLDQAKSVYSVDCYKS